MTYLKKIFTLPIYKDEAETRQAYLLHIIVWTLVCIPIPFVIYTATLASENIVRVLVQTAFGESVNLVLLIMLSRKYVRAASILQVSAFWLFFTATAITGAGVNSEAYLLGYTLVITIAGILLGGVGSFTFAFLSLLAGALMLYAQSLGVIFHGMSKTPLTTWMVSFVLFPVGAILQYLASSTVRNALEHARASEEKYRLISQVSSDYTFATEVHKDGSASLSWAAGAFEKMTGYTYEEYVASGGWLGHVHPDDLQKDAQGMEKLYKNQDVQSEIRTFAKNGEVRWEQIFAHPIWDQKENRLVGIIGAVRDITKQKQFEADLANERDLLQIFMDNIPDTVWFKDTESRFVRINQAQARFLNVNDPQDAIGKTDLDFQNLELAQVFMEEEKQILETNTPVLSRVEYNPARDGEPRWLTTTKVPVKDKSGKTIGIIGISRDVTEQKQIESTLAYERDILQIFMDNIPDPAYFKDTESHFQRINQAHARFLGVDSPQDAIGKTDLDYQIPELAREFLIEEKQIMETGQPVLNRIEFNTTKDGKPIWFSATKVPARNVFGQIIGIVGISRNITEQKRIEATLAYERDILQIFMDNIPDNIYFKDTESRFVRINQAQARFLGVDSPQDAIGKTDFDFELPEYAKEFMRVEKQIMETGQSVLGLIELNPTKDGKPIWFSTTKVPAKNEFGQIIGTIGISRDITEQKMAEEFERNRRTMLENVIKLGKIVTEVNDINTTFEKIWHGIHDDLQFDHLAIFLYNAEHDSLDRALGTDIFGNMEKTPGKSFPVKEQSRLAQTLNIPDGLYFTHNYDVENKIPEDSEMYGVKDFAAVAVWVGEKPVAVICVDHLLTKLPITDTQLEALRLFAGYAGLAIENARLNSALQNELFQRKETLLHQSAILNGIPDMAWLKDKESRYVAVNEQFVQTAGMKMEEIIGKTDFEIWNEGFAEKYKNDDLEVMRSGQRKEHIEEPQVDSTGREYWVETTKTPILNEQNEVIGTTGIAREVTERKKAELERESLITELEAKNAELERFTYTVSHDLKSPLVTIRGFLGYLERDAQAGNFEKLNHDKQRIESAVGKMQALLNDLLELSRIGRLVNTPVEVPFHEIVKDALEILHGQIEANNVLIEYKNDNIIVKCDRVRITEVLQNLIDNAIKFMGDQPKPHITIGTTTNEKNETIFFVRDNGIGIDKQYHERIFTLFNKLDADAEGTGIGLTLIKRIIEIHNGRIWLESEPGKGTTFYFTLNQP